MTDKHLITLIKKKRGKAQINKIRNEREVTNNTKKNTKYKKTLKTTTGQQTGQSGGNG